MGVSKVSDKKMKAMDIKERISFYTRRQQRLSNHARKLKEAQTIFIENIKSLRESISQGETSGDPVLDYAICHASISTDKTFSDTVNKEYQYLQERLSTFTPSEIYVLDFDKFIVELSNPAYVVKPDRSAILFNVVKAFKIEETNMKGLELKLHSLEPCKAEDIGRAESSYCSYRGCGWSDIDEKYRSGRNSNPLLLKKIYEQFGREVDKDLSKMAEEAYQEVARKAIIQIDSLLASGEGLYAKLEAQRKELEQLREKAEAAKGRIVVSISDQLDKDAAELNLEMATLRNIRNYDKRRDYEWQLQKLARCLDDAVAIGLHTYKRDVAIEIRPGKQTVFNVSKYIRTLCSYLEIAAENVAVSN